MSVLINSGGFGTKMDETATVKPLAQCTLAEMLNIIQMHYNNEITLPAYWSEGDSTTLSLSAINTKVGYKGSTYESHAAQNVTITIVGFDHDTLVRPINGHTKAAVTFMMSPLAEKGFMNEDGTNDGGWQISDRQDWCYNVNKFRAMLPSTLSSEVKLIQKVTSLGPNKAELYTSEEYGFLFSLYEIFGDYSPWSIYVEGSRYDYIYYSGLIASYSDPYDSNSAMWSRTCPDDDESGVFAVYYNFYGTNAMDNIPANDVRPLVLGFCV